MVGRDGDVAIYKKKLDEVDSEAFNYEVIAIKRHNGYEIAGVKMPPAEMYPSDSQWGEWAFTCIDREDADKRFVQLKEKLLMLPQQLCLMVKSVVVVVLAKLN